MVAVVGRVHSNGAAERFRLGARLINRILGYKPGYNFRGFGDANSGLKELTSQQFDTLLEAFKSRSKTHPVRRFFSECG